MGGLTNGLGSVTGLPGTPASSLTAAFASSPAALAQALACPVGKVAAGVTSGVPGVSTVTGQLPTVLCAANILGYAFRTTYVEPNGSKVVRYFHALAGVPTLLDVNGDGVPDFVGTLTVSLTVNGLSLNITRLLLPASTRVSIEAVALDPASPQTYVGFGEDGTPSGTAGTWTTSVNVLGIGDGTVDLGLGMSSGLGVTPTSGLGVSVSLGVPPTLGLVGEVLSGNTPDAPTTTDRGDVLFAPVPANLTTEIKLGQGRQEAIVTSPAPTTVTAHVNLISPGDEKDVDATVDQLPTSVDIVHVTAAGHDTTTYTGSARVHQVSVNYHDHQGSTIPTAAQFTASDVPTGITFDQAGQTTSVTTAGGPVGSIFASIAELAAGAPAGSTPPAPTLPGTPDFAAYRQNAVGFSVAAQFSGLQSVVYTAAPLKAVVAANTANEALLTYESDTSSGTAKASVDVDKIPSQVTVAIDPTGQISYTANADINSIVASASGLPQFPTVPGSSQRLQSVGFVITGVPQALSGGMLGSGELSLAAGTAAGGPASDPDGGGIGSIGVSASSANAPTLTIPGTPDYAAYRQNASGFAVAGQFSGLAKLDVLPTPLNAKLTTDVANEALLTYENDTSSGPAKASLDINKIPAAIAVAIDPTGKISYTASSDISSIVASASALPQFPTVPGSSQQLQNVGITINGVPQAVSGGIAGNGEITFDAGTAAGGPATDPDAAGLGSVEATASSATAPTPTIPATASYATFKQDDSGFAGHVRLGGPGGAPLVSHVDILPSPVDATVDSTALQQVGLEADRNVAGKQLNVTGTLLSTISQLHFFQTDDAAGTSYELDSGGGNVQSFTLDGTAGGGALPRGVTSFAFGLHDVPPAAKVSIGGGASDLVSARFGHFGVLHNFIASPIGEITASINGGSAPSTYTDSKGKSFTGADGLGVALDSSNDIITGGFDLHGLRGLSYGSQPFTQAGIDIDPASARPMVLGFSQQQSSGPDLTASGVIDKLPPNMVLQIQPASDVPVHYSADAVIDEIEVQTNYGMSSGVPKAIVRLDDIPKLFTVCLRTDGQPPSCEPSNAFDAGNGAGDRLVGAAFETDKSANPSAHVEACFDATNPCAAGTKDLTVDVPSIPDTIELEFGASAHVGSGPGFDATCIDPFDDFSVDHPIDDAENAASIVACIATFPVVWLADVVGGTGAAAQAWVNTAGQPLNAKAVFTDPIGGIFTDPVVLTFTLPTLSADQFYLDDSLTVGGGFTSTTSGSLTCSGGGLNLATSIGIPADSIDISSIVDPINDIIDTVDDLPGVDISDIPTSVDFGGVSEPISADLIPSFC
ncbi:MAG TPA: hypothetical protein VHW26_08940 [Solirubrobacteraceae bacterium]|nr:hypothetical protein [Solirubrobacteraceae bacterium]